MSDSLRGSGLKAGYGLAAQMQKLQKSPTGNCPDNEDEKLQLKVQLIWSMKLR